MLSEDSAPALSQVTNMMKVSPAAAFRVPSVLRNAIDRAIDVRPAVDGQIELAAADAVDLAPLRVDAAEVGLQGR